MTKKHGEYIRDMQTGKQIRPVKVGSKSLRVKEILSSDNPTRYTEIMLTESDTVTFMTINKLEGSHHVHHYSAESFVQILFLFTEMYARQFAQRKDRKPVNIQDARSTEES